MTLESGTPSNGLTAADRVAITYLAVVAALIVFSSNRITLWWLLVPAHALGIAVIVAIARRYRESSSGTGGRSSKRIRPPSIVRYWYPLILIPLTYKELGYVIHLVHPHDFDAELAAIDRRMFGGDPIIWLDRFNYPGITLVMQLSYLTYYLTPIVLGIVLWRARRFADFRFFLFVVLLGFYVSYLGYIAVPAIGPRFFLNPNSVRPLTGPGVAAIRHFLDRMEGVTRDCFPSGHTELTLLVLFSAYRFHKRTFWVLVAPGTALVLSTVYLRYHYVIDVIAGGAIAVAIALTADRLHRIAGGGTIMSRNDAGALTDSARPDE